MNRTFCTVLVEVSLAASGAEPTAATGAGTVAVVASVPAAPGAGGEASEAPARSLNASASRRTMVARSAASAATQA